MLTLTLYRVNQHSNYGVKLIPPLEEKYPNIEYIENIEEDYDFTQTLLKHNYSKDEDYVISDVRYNVKDIESGKLFKDSNLIVELTILKDNNIITVINPPIITTFIKELPVNLIHSVTINNIFTNYSINIITKENLILYFLKSKEVKKLYNLYTDLENMFVLMETNPF